MYPTGIITALITPLTRDGDLCVNCLEEMISFQMSKGVNGLFLMGTYGEGFILSPSVRKKLLSKAVELVPSRSVIIAHVGAADLGTTVELARHAKDVGVSAVSSVGPVYHRPSKQGLISYYEAIARVGADVMVYNNKGRQGYNISPDDFEVIASRVPGVTGVKDTSYDVEQLQEYVERFGSKYFVAGAGDSLILYTLLVGAKAHICGVSNAFPEVVVALRRAFEQGDIRRALKLQSLINRVRKLVRSFGVEPSEVLREVLKLRGVEAGHPPVQLGGLDEEARSRVRREFGPILEAVEGL